MSETKPNLSQTEEATLLLSDFLEEAEWESWPNDDSYEISYRKTRLGKHRVITGYQFRRTDNNAVVQCVVEVRDSSLSSALPTVICADWNPLGGQQYEFGIDKAKGALEEALQP